MTDVSSSLLARPATPGFHGTPVPPEEQVTGARPYDTAGLVGVGLTVAAFIVLFAQPAMKLVRDWWNDPDAGHGLLLFPVAIWLAWRSGRQSRRLHGLDRLVLASSARG